MILVRILAWFSCHILSWHDGDRSELVRPDAHQEWCQVWKRCKQCKEIYSWEIVDILEPAEIYTPLAPYRSDLED